MQVIEIASAAIDVPPWNPNEMDSGMREHLRVSIERFGLVVPLVVRPTNGGRFETIGGAQRLAVLIEMGLTTLPCVVAQTNDAEARLLSQALNHIAGEDDLGRRAELIRDLRLTVPDSELLALLPETKESLESLASLGVADMAAHLQAWQRVRSARLRHFSAQLTSEQLGLVESVLGQFRRESSSGDEDNPNRRGVALYLLCQAYAELHGVER